MRKYTNARLVFTRLACVLAVISFAVYSCASGASAQWAGNYGTSTPQMQAMQQQALAPQVTTSQAAPPQVSPTQSASSQALPEDWPQAIVVPGMEKVSGLVQGENNISYSINVLSKDGNTINFQVKAFCVYNPDSDYAMLHVLNKPLAGVIDSDKKTLQIDFSPLGTGLKSVGIIDKADVDKVLLQDKDSMVLNTAMAVDSADQSQVKFSISDMSLMTPDGTLNEFSLPGPVPAYYSPETSRFSTVAFDEMTNVMEQNYVMIQQNTYINVVNVVNQVNIVNVVGYGGCGWGGGWGGGWDGGYGGYGGWGGGCMPYTDPLPLVQPPPMPPIGIPPDVPMYSAKHSGLPDDIGLPLAVKKPAGGKGHGKDTGVSSKSAKNSKPAKTSTTKSGTSGKVTAPTKPVSSVTKPANPAGPVNPVSPAVTGSAAAKSKPKSKATSGTTKTVSTPAKKTTTKTTPAKTTSAKTTTMKTPSAVKSQVSKLQSAPKSAPKSAVKQAVTKPVQSTKTSMPRSTVQHAPSTKAYSAPKAVKAPVSSGSRAISAPHTSGGSHSSGKGGGHR